MYSLQWFRNHVARVSSSAVLDGALPNSEQELITTTSILDGRDLSVQENVASCGYGQALSGIVLQPTTAPNQDATDHGLLSDTTRSHHAQTLSGFEVHSTTAPIQAATNLSVPPDVACNDHSVQRVNAGDVDMHTPATPQSRSDVGTLNRIIDSGYHSAHQLCGKRQFEHDETDTTPTRAARARPPTRYDEHARQIYNKVSSTGNEAQRLRHDSMLDRADSSKYDRSVDTEEAGIGPSGADESEMLCTEASASQSLMETEQVLYNDDTDDREVVSSCLSSISTLSLAKPLLDKQSPITIKGIGFLPPRDILNAPFEQKISAKSSFYRIPNGIDPPAILQQTSCLQCVLKALPCDQKLPHCSRCIRSGHGPCLVQRELLAKEKWDAGLWGFKAGEGYTVLVRLGRDDTTLWEAKKKLEDDMLGYLKEKLDKANWVLPWDDGTREGYKQRRGGREQELRLDSVRGGHV